jgi:hypothetical protein
MNIFLRENCSFKVEIAKVSWNFNKWFGLKRSSKIPVFEGLVVEG